MSRNRAGEERPRGEEPVQTRYARLLEAVFFAHYQEGVRTVEFRRAELEEAAEKFSVQLPKNPGDIIYSFRYRADLPRRITDLLGPGEDWVIRPAGRGRYRMEITRGARFAPAAGYAEIRVPDATPGLIRLYALGDEQALLAILRYNRLVDVFLRITCYPLQSHLRTTVRGMGQVETDEVYVGLDHRGAHYVVPVQAKGGKDVLNVVQVEQDFAMCRAKFPDLVCRPVGAQFMADDLIALFEFIREPGGDVRIADEKHYRLVPGKDAAPGDFAAYHDQGE